MVLQRCPLTENFERAVRIWRLSEENGSCQILPILHKLSFVTTSYLHRIVVRFLGRRVTSWYFCRTINKDEHIANCSIAFIKKMLNSGGGGSALCAPSGRPWCANNSLRFSQHNNMNDCKCGSIIAVIQISLISFTFLAMNTQNSCSNWAIVI